MDECIVISVTFQVDGDGRTEDVVRRLHKEGRLKKLFAVILDGIEEFLRVVDTSKAGAADDGVGHFDRNFLKGQSR